MNIYSISTLSLFKFHLEMYDSFYMRIVKNQKVNIPNLIFYFKKWYLHLNYNKIILVLCNNKIKIHIVCQGRLDSFYLEFIGIYYIKWVRTSWTCNKWIIAWVASTISSIWAFSRLFRPISSLIEDEVILRIFRKIWN